MEEYKKYQKTALQEMRPYLEGEDLTGVSVSQEDTPEEGGMIARGSDNDAQWYVSKAFFNQNYALADSVKTDGDKFVEHIKAHLPLGVPVICKICGKTVAEIAQKS